MKVTTLLYRIYTVVLVLPLFAVITILTSLASAIGCILGGERIFSYWPGKIWSLLTLRLLLCPVEVLGRKHIPYEKCIVTANHASALDIFLLYGYMGVRFKWVMKGAIRKIPFVGWACEKCGFIFVSKTTEGAKQVIRDAEAALEKGYHIFIFPEGSRTPNGKLLPLRRGAFKMAMDTNVPILPIKISGAYEAYSRDALFPRRQRLKMEIHPAIPAPMNGEEVRRVMEECEALLR